MIDFTPKKTRHRRFFGPAAFVLIAALLVFASGYLGMRLYMNTHVPYVPQAEAETPEPAFAWQQIVPPLPAQEAEPIFTVPPGRQLALPDLFDGANPAVVAIATEVTGRNVFGRTVTLPASGSGFLISSDGYIVTNDHVIENATSITILMYDGRRFPARVVGRAPSSDIAVIKIEGQGFAHLAFGNSDIIRVGEQVAAIGNPLGELANSMTVGHISAISRDINIDGDSHVMIQTDAAINRGNSGGPLLNLYGEVIGVVSAKSMGMGIEGLGFAIPSNYTAKIVQDLIEYGFVRGRAILGILVNVQGESVVVANIGPDSAADRSGMQIGDVIISMDGKRISSFEDLRAVLDNASPGDTVRITLMRRDSEINVTAVLDEFRPPDM